VTAVCRATHSSKSLFGRGWFRRKKKHKSICALATWHPHSSLSKGSTATLKTKPRLARSMPRRYPRKKRWFLLHQESLWNRPRLFVSMTGTWG